MQSFIELRRAIESSRRAPEDAVAAALAAIAEQEDAIQAFEALAPREAALAHARKAEGPLAGVAVGVKDIFDTHDLATTYGSPIFAGHRPMVDAAVVAMLRAAGATIAGKTVTTEYAYLHPAKTFNPHDPAHTPGGSSSGSAAAVAAGMVPAAIGTQTGGSIIRPASFCGVAGYKASFRTVPTTGMKTFSWSLDTVGFFAADVADVAAFAAAATGRALTVEPVDPAALKIGLYRTSIRDEASEAMNAALDAAAKRAADAGAHVVEIDEPALLARAREAHGTVQDHEAGKALAGDLDLYADRMSTMLRDTLVEGRSIPPERYDEARALARRARHETTALFANVDVLLTPSAPGAALASRETTGSSIFNRLWTLTGNPCVNVPGLADSQGMPLGMQVVARFGDDRRALSAAAWLQDVLAR